MISLAYLGEDKHLNLDKSVKKLLIVRREPDPFPKGFIYVPQLSPSTDLFNKTQRWKKGNFTKKEMLIISDFNNIESNDYWWYLYKDAFNLELNCRNDMKLALERLINLSESEDIYLFCYCKDTCRCHRGLVGEYLVLRNIAVDFRIKKDNEIKSEQVNLF